VEREYAVRVLGSLSTEQRARLLDGVDIEGQKAAFKSIEDGGGEGINRWYRVVITEGRNREVRKLFDKVGLAVSRLIRIRYGTVVLPRGLKRGVWVELDDSDVRTIRTLAGGDQATTRIAPNDAPRGKKPQRGQDRGERGNDRGGERGAERGGERGGERGDRPERAGRGNEPRAERDPQAPRGKGSQHGGDRGQDRGGDRQGGRPNGGGAPQQNRPPRGPRQDGPPQGGGNGGGNGGNGNSNGGGGRGPRGGGEDPLHIPNPLEQTFDKRFVSGSKRITTGFGRPTEEPSPGGGGGGNRKGEPRQPDPMQTSVGYIGAEAYFTRPGGGNNKGRGGRRR